MVKRIYNGHFLQVAKMIAMQTGMTLHQDITQFASNMENHFGL